MEVKKNPNKDLLRSRPQYFALGMVISLSLAITAFEWRTEQGEIVIDTFDLDAWDHGVHVGAHHVTSMPRVSRTSVSSAWCRGSAMFQP